MADIPDGLAAGDQAFLGRLLARIATDERVTACFLGGSHAAGTADELSDLDLYLITTDGGFDGVRDDRHALMHALGDVVFLEEHEHFGFLMLLYMYADGVHGELALAPAQDLPTVHAGPYRALLDKDGLLEGRRFPPWRLGPDERRDATRRLLVWFWYDRRLLDVALAREQLWTAHYYLDRCRQACVNLARLGARPDVWPGGYEKAEDVVDSAALAPLAASVVPLEPAAMRAATELVTRIYRDLGRTVGDRQGVDFPERLAEAVTAALVSGSPSA